MSAMPQDQHPVLSEAEYLAFDRASEIKHEYVEGAIIAMAGASDRHNLIVAYTLGALIARLGSNSPCVVRPSDARLRVSDLSRYRYPDLTVTCQPAQFADDKQDILLNPTVIIEVLSPATRSTDFDAKLYEYRQIASVQDYLLVETAQPRITRYQRQSGDKWLLSDTIGLDATLTLESIGVNLPLAAVYAQVTFETPDERT